MQKKIEEVLLVIKSIFFVIIFISFFSLGNAKDVEKDDRSGVDNTTYNSYSTIMDEGQIGQVWTDKSVFSTDVTLENNFIRKEEDEDFLISLSAFSTGLDLNKKEAHVKDIVILQDLSTSMIEHQVTGSSGSMTRLQASKNAINTLLELIAKANESLSTEDEKFRVSLLTFAGQSATINQAEVLFDLVKIDYTNLSTLQTIVSGMRCAVPINTDINPGLDLSLEQIKTNGRKNVDAAIISFLDGVPNPESVAEKAIEKANKIKNDYNIVMYSVILNDDALGGTSTLADKVGQGLSSNYNFATSTSNLGLQTGNSYYYIPKTADELAKSFEDIIKLIQKRVYPLESNTNITFIDRLGEYMEVNKIKSLIYNGNVYSNVSSSVEGNKTTYLFSNAILDSLGNPTNTSAIKITVTKSDAYEIGDILTISIPSSLVPLAVYEVSSVFQENSTLYTTSLKEAKPITIVYSTSVKKDIFHLYKENDLNMQKYIKDHGYSKDNKGYAYFYANYYESGENGTTEVLFTPFLQNDYYYYTEDTYLYKKKDDNYILYTGTELSNETYYIKKTIYKIGNKMAELETYEIVTNVESAKKDNKNQWYFSSGTKKNIEDEESKNSNLFETARNLKSIMWDNQQVKSFLGNNGVVLISMDDASNSVDNPDTGSFASIVAIIAFGGFGFLIYRYIRKHNRFV